MKEVPFLRRIFSTRILPSWTILLFDISILIFSVVVAFALRFTLNEVASMGRSIRITMAIVVVVNLIFFRLFRTYSNVLRLSSFVDVMHIFVALTLGFLVTGAASLTCTWIWDWTFSPLSVLMITYVVSFLLLATSRMAIKMLNDYFNQSVKTQLNTYIYGTQSGMDIAKAVRTGVEHKFHIRGFITDEPDLAGKVMMGVNVYRNDERLIERIRQDRVDAVIVSPDKAELLKESDVADRLLQENVKIFLAPEVIRF